VSGLYEIDAGGPRLIACPSDPCASQDEGFLAADALYALQGPDSRWIPALRRDAVQSVGECG
jgi:hypothetical protein